jgi:hypothetical protein
VAVFLVGMMLLTAARQTRAAVVDAVRGAVAVPVRSTARWVANTVTPDLPFRLDGDRLGQIVAFVIRRDHPGETAEVRLTVRLAGGEPSRLSDCTIVPAAEPDFSLDQGFRCAGRTAWGLERIGSVRFEPSGLERPLSATRRTAQQLRAGDPFRVSGSSGERVQVEASGKDGAMVHILAGDGGASIRIQDGAGRALLRLLADSSGAFLHIRDEKGREVMRLLAGDSGFALDIDSAGVHR